MEIYNFTSFDNLTNFNTINTNIDDEDYEECISADSMQSMEQFLKCFKYFLSKSILFSVITLSFCVMTVILNMIIIYFIIKLNRRRTVFDRIFVGHAIVDSLVGFLVIPNYCIYSLFGYWPLGKYFCHFYVSVDYTICHCSILHMLFIAYCRLRSLLSPKNFEQEWFINHANVTMFFLWIMSSLLWLPAVNLIINFSFKNRECYFNFEPAYIIAQDFIAYLLPMSFILGVTIYILKILNQRDKERKKFHRKRLLRKSAAHLQILVGRSSKKNNSSNNTNKNSKMTNINKTNSSNELANTTRSQLSNSELSMNLDDPEFGSLDNSQIINTNNNCSKKNLGKPKLESVLTVPSDKRTNIELSNIKLKNLQPTSNIELQKTPSQLLCQQQKQPTPQFVHSNSTGSGNTIGAGVTQLVDTINETNAMLMHASHPVRHRNKKTFNLKALKRIPFSLNAVNKLYLIILTFVVLWTPFCIFWPINSICESCISPFVLQVSYWMGYCQSLINPILLLILNPNYNKSHKN